MLKTAEQADKALLEKSSLDIQLVEEHADDKRMAELMKFSTVKCKYTALEPVGRQHQLADTFSKFK